MTQAAMTFQGVPFNNGKTCPTKMLPPGALGTSRSPRSMLIIRHKPLKQWRISSPAKHAAPNASTPLASPDCNMLLGDF